MSVVKSSIKSKRRHLIKQVRVRLKGVKGGLECNLEREGARDSETEGHSGDGQDGHRMRMDSGEKR